MKEKENNDTFSIISFDVKKLGQSFGIYRQWIWEEKLKIRFVQDFVSDQ
jgi:hypothetical protein